MKNITIKNNLLKKFFSFSIGGYIKILISLLIVPISTRVISPEQFGIASLINVIQNILFLIYSFGTQHSFVRFFYEEKNKGKLLYNCLFYPFFISIFFFMGIFLFKKNISIFIVGEYDQFIWFILNFGGIFITLQIFSNLVIRMNQHAKFYSFVIISEKILEGIFLLIFYKIYGNDYKVLSLSFLAAIISITLIAIFVERKYWNFKGEGNINRKEIIKYSLPLSLTMALNWIFASCDKISIKILSNLSELGVYSGAFKLIAIITVIQTGFTTFWDPVANEHYFKHPEDKKFFTEMLDIFSLLFFILGIGLLFTRDIVILFLGEKYREALYVFPMLVFIPIMYSISEITMLGIAFSKKTKYFLYISIIVSLTNLFGNIVLVPTYGAKGAAISTGISYVLFFSLRTYFSNRLINFGFNLKRIYIVIFLMVLYAISLTFYNNIYFTVLIGILLEILVLIIYFPIIKKFYFKYLKNTHKIKNI